MGLHTTLQQVPVKQLIFEKWLKGKGTAILVIVTIVALGAALAAAESLNQWATDTEKWWGFVSTAFTVVGGTVGLWFVWLKFIRAREFAPKLDLTLTTGKVFLSDAEGNLHWCRAKLDNKGTESITYLIEAVPILYKHGVSTQGQPLVSLVPANNALGSLVDVGATSYEYFQIAVSLADAQAVTFQVKISKGGTVWWSHITQSNLKEQPAAK